MRPGATSGLPSPSNQTALPVLHPIRFTFGHDLTLAALLCAVIGIAAGIVTVQRRQKVVALVGTAAATVSVVSPMALALRISTIAEESAGALMQVHAQYRLDWALVLINLGAAVDIRLLSTSTAGPLDRPASAVSGQPTLPTASPDES